MLKKEEVFDCVGFCVGTKRVKVDDGCLKIVGVGGVCIKVGDVNVGDVCVKVGDADDCFKKVDVGDEEGCVKKVDVGGVCVKVGVGDDDGCVKKVVGFEVRAKSCVGFGLRCFGSGSRQN